MLAGGSPRFRTHPDKKRLNHVGSLYRKVIAQTQKVAQAPPAFLPADFPWGEWEDRMGWVLFQGELTHYGFFRDLFTGDAFNPKDPGNPHNKDIWDPDNPNFPARRFKRQTAYTARPNTIRNEKARRLAWLADLHYWIILALLDVAYRGVGLALRYKAIDNMTLGLWFLLHFARFPPT